MTPEVSLPDTTMIDFRDTTFELSNDFRHLKQICAKLNLGQLVTLLDEHLEQIKNDSFSIAVVGEFKRGKSTFINALLGKEILPSDILPTSATLNRVTYGLKPAAKIIFRGDTSRQERTQNIDLEELANYVTKLTPDAQAVAATVEEAIVYYPIPYLRHSNVEIIDTPGLEDENAMTDVTMSVLPSLDAAIMVIMPQSPFSGSEGEFLNNLLEHGLGRVIFVVTAMDRILRAKERERVVPAITERIQRSIETYVATHYEKNSEEYQRQLQKIGKPKVFGLSGYQALQAKIAHDEELLQQSHLPEFEKMLERFLTEETGLISLRRRANHLKAYSEEILAALASNIQHIPNRQQIYADLYQEFMLLLDVIQQMGQDNLATINRLPEDIEKRLEPVIQAFQQEVIQKAEDVIGNLAVDAHDLETEAATAVTQQIGSAVDEAVRIVAQKWQTRVAQLMQWEWTLALNQLQALTTTTDYALRHIQTEITQINENLSISGDKSDMVAYTPSPLVIRLQEYQGYNHNFDTPIEMIIMPDQLRPVFDLPQNWIQTVPFSVPQKKRFMPAPLHVKQFRAAYKAAVMPELMENRFQITKITHELQTFVEQNFNKLAQELKMTINQAQQTRYEIQGHVERLNVVVEQEVKEYQRMQSEVQRIWQSAVQIERQIDAPVDGDNF
ncbi:MAG: hypothetical protein GY796_05480 [Chloroflexi bacterium]|nr:hypothetical protein [Chloroflexota bacterium]